MNEQTSMAISRRFRPQTFGEVCGQPTIVTTLKNAVKFNRAAHAYLFTGARGTGKTTLARIFAKSLNCRNLNENCEPCGKCSSCKEITEGRSLDVLEIDGASNRGIDDIRNLNEVAGYAPSSGKYKIYIIDEVHMLTKEAFNALLKLLEEPPVKVKFFFATTEAHKILPTILSRCQRFDLKRIQEETILCKLQEIIQKIGVSVSVSGLQLIVNQSEGSLRDAESLLDQILCYEQGDISEETIRQLLGRTEQDVFFALDEAAKTGDLKTAFSIADQIFTDGKNLGAFFDSLLEHYSEILKFQMNISKKNYKYSAAIYTKEQCLYILDYLFDCLQKNVKATLKKQSVEVVLLHIIRSAQLPSLEKIADKLIHLEKSITARTSARSSEQSALNQAQLENQIAEEGQQAFEPAALVNEQNILHEEKKNPVKNAGDYDVMLNFAAVELNGVVKK